MQNKKEKTLNFGHQNDKFIIFTNFTDHQISIENKTWATSEHYFQAKKYEGTKYEEIVRNAKTPSEAKSLGNSRQLPLRKDWEEVKEDFMFKAILAKFTQHEDLKQILLETNDLYLNEKAPDSYWGDGMNGSGLNRLGYVLMKVRDEIKKN
eukprot:gene6951-11113_t